MPLLLQATIFLATAVVAVSISRRLGLGAVLGYLAGGIVIGPWGLRLIAEVDSILHFAEFGVVLLLFIIGLELQVARLWSMRRSVFGVGALQVGTTAAALAGLGWLAGLGLESAVVVGLALSLSSTAFALQTLAERHELTSRHGRAAFSILLFQDLAVIPLLALVPLLGPGDGPAFGEELWHELTLVVGVIAAVVIGERYLLRYLLKVIAATKVHELFTATALLTVAGTALLMEEVGLSMGLGAFLAGVLLADSEYRHELEADIEPFKGLLLGLFFIAVGMSVNVGLLLERPLDVLELLAALMATKALILFALGRASGLNGASARSLAAVISQGGEFAFVIFGVAVGAQVLEPGLVELLIVVVTLSMAITPVLVALDDALQKRRPAEVSRDYEVPPEENQVIIAGFGRFGQIIARILRARKIGFTALEVSPDQLALVRRFGNKAYYGDAARLELLRAARADQARAFILAVDDIEASVRIAEMVRKHFPKLKIYARAQDRKHVHRLMDLGVSVIQRDTFLSSLDLAREVLVGLGLTPSESERVVRTFKEHDEKRLYDDYAMHNDEERMVQLAKKAAEELEELFEQDRRLEVGR